MTAGYCRCCDRLVAIQAKEHKQQDGRNRNWYPVPHENERGAPCEGEKKPL